MNLKEFQKKKNSAQIIFAREMLIFQSISVLSSNGIINFNSNFNRRYDFKIFAINVGQDLTIKDLMAIKVKTEIIQKVKDQKLL